MSTPASPLIDLQSAPSRRHFLARALAVGGSGFLLANMKAWGMDLASTRDAPPVLAGSGKGKTVVILGAGLAGMTAAYEMSKLGYTCKVIEARAFAGGRCQTARTGTVLEELGGEKQVCGFAPGQYINFGPWRIPFNHRSTLHYTSSFGVPLELFNNDNDAAYVYNDNAAGALRGRRLRQYEVKADTRGYVDELLAKGLQSGAMDQQVGAADKQLLIDYLVNEGYLSRKDLRYRGTEGRGFKVNPGAGISPGAGVPSDPLGFSDLLQSKLGHIYHSVHEFTQQSTMLQPVGGMDAIARAFEKRVGKMIRYNTEVLSLRNHSDGVDVGVRDARTGATSVVKGDFCLCTLPLSVLRQVDTDFSPAFKTAMMGAAYAPVCKIGLQMGRRFWEEDDGIYGGHVYTDTKGINLISLPSSNWQGRKGTLLGCYSFAGDAAEFSALSLKERADYALAAGEKIFPGQYRKNVESAFSVAWHRVKYNLGGWAEWSEEARAKAYPVLVEGEQRTLLAGEHMSYLGGWQAGAIESAWQQMARIHQRLSAQGAAA
ncbi:FAD-dependent oxidoreductase [Massilia sp. DWR3-1-1]|uniref:flavin monoamine oxidase family protein n=1 Tax=Massilia sp. DWR3-1-1 TaxID=2804559 RepID=UPI003CF69D3D